MAECKIEDAVAPMGAEAAMQWLKASSGALAARSRFKSSTRCLTVRNSRWMRCKQIRSPIETRFDAWSWHISNWQDSSSFFSLVLRKNAA